MRRPAPLEAVARRLRNNVLVRSVRQRLYDRRFAGTREWKNLARGIYGSFDEARQDAPAAMPVAYVLDDETYAQNLSIESHDYPALFWLRNALEGGSTLLDLGGHVGLQYYEYRRYLRIAPGARWIVCEQPHVAALGRRMAESRDSPHLSFVESLDGIEADVFFSAGCLQFIEEPLPRLLERLACRPRAVLVNKVPLHERASCVTLQNTGRSFAPCHLFNATELITSIEAMGYRLADRWRCPDRSVRIPFHPEYDIRPYSGLFFEASDRG